MQNPATLMIALLLLTACGDGTGPEAARIPAELAGRWVAGPACAECGFTLTSTQNEADSLNFVTFAGATVEIEMTRAGAFRLGYGGTVDHGQARAAGGALIVTDAAGVVDTIDYALRGDLLDLAFRRTFEVIDFDGDGAADPARARGTFRRE